MQLIDRETVQDLLSAGGPANRDAPEPLIAQPKMQPPIVLAAESRATIHDLALPARPDLRRHLGADGAAVAARPDELELDPVRGVGDVAVHRRLPLPFRTTQTGRPIVEGIAHRDPRAVRQAGDARPLPDIDDP